MTVCLVLLLTVSVTNIQAKTILVLGDSLSAAYQIRQEMGWVNLLSKKLAAIDAESQVINASVGGATTAAGVQRLPGLLKQFSPDIVILELGGNDGLQGKPLSHIKRNLEELIQLSLTSNANVILMGIKIPPNYGPRYTEPFFNQYEELARQYNLLYVPFILGNIPDNSSLMKADGIHPTEEAQPQILNHIWPTIQRALP